MNRAPQCIDCKFANWQRTSSGRLHPSGDGRCKWQMPAIRLPISMYFFGSITPSGCHVNRRDEWQQCPQYQRESSHD